MNKIIKLFILFLFSACIISCSKEYKTEKQNSPEKSQNNIAAKVTFVELGSVNCIPCKQMQPIMRSIEEKYNGQVKVVFHDVWKDKKPAQQYGISLIPTQVFLDENDNEFFRHEGFFPEDEIDKLLQSKGITISK